MEIESVGKWATAAGAVIGAIAGVWNLLLQMRGKRDRFRVGMGTVEPTIEEETMMNVVSLSDHPIKIADCGFILPSGRFQSFRLAWETGDLTLDEFHSRGSRELAERGAFYEGGYVLRDRVVGAFAMSVTQRRPRLCFSSTTPYWRRVWIRLLTAWRGERYLA
jgi:hypothetical protein